MSSLITCEYYHVGVRAESTEQRLDHPCIWIW